MKMFKKVLCLGLAIGFAGQSYSMAIDTQEKIQKLSLYAVVFVAAMPVINRVYPQLAEKFRALSRVQQLAVSAACAGLAAYGIYKKYYEPRPFTFETTSDISSNIILNMKVPKVYVRAYSLIKKSVEHTIAKTISPMSGSLAGLETQAVKFDFIEEKADKAGNMMFSIIVSPIFSRYLASPILFNMFAKKAILHELGKLQAKLKLALDTKKIIPAQANLRLLRAPLTARVDVAAGIAQEKAAADHKANADHKKDQPQLKADAKPQTKPQPSNSVVVWRPSSSSSAPHNSDERRTNAVAAKK